MTVTASSGSTRVDPQLFDTLPLSSVRQAAQQDLAEGNGEVEFDLVSFFPAESYALARAEVSDRADGEREVGQVDGCLGVCGFVIDDEQESFALIDAHGGLDVCVG